MTLYLVLKFVHVIGAAVLLGTGAGIAFFMLLAHCLRATTTGFTGAAAAAAKLSGRFKVRMTSVPAFRTVMPSLALI